MQYSVGDITSTERGTGARANKGKVSFSLVPLHLLAGVARIFMGGKLKYAAWNWSKGCSYSVTFDCVLRHLFKWYYCCEDLDPESMENHLDHAIANLLMLKHYIQTFKEGDDRPDTKLTCFSDELLEVNTPFDEEAYLARNTQVKKRDV